MAWDTQWSPSFVNMFKATGKQIFCNNVFTSYKLIEELYHNKLLCCGTLRSGRKEFPACLYDKAAIKRMKRGDVVWRMKGPVLPLT